MNHDFFSGRLFRNGQQCAGRVVQLQVWKGTSMINNLKDYNQTCLPRCLGEGPVNLLAQTVSELNNWAKRQVMVMINLLMIYTTMEISVHVRTQSPAAALV